MAQVSEISVLDSNGATRDVATITALVALIGQVTASPGANTVLERLKSLQAYAAHPDSVQLLQDDAATGGASAATSGRYLWSVYGTWDGAAARLQYSPNGSVWLDLEVDGGRWTTAQSDRAMLIDLPAGDYRVSISSAGGATSLTSTLSSIRR